MEQDTGKIYLNKKDNIIYIQTSYSRVIVPIILK